MSVYHAFHGHPRLSGLLPMGPMMASDAFVPSEVWARRLAAQLERGDFAKPSCVGQGGDPSFGAPRALMPAEVDPSDDGAGPPFPSPSPGRSGEPA